MHLVKLPLAVHDSASECATPPPTQRYGRTDYACEVYCATLVELQHDVLGGLRTPIAWSLFRARPRRASAPREWARLLQTFEQSAEGREAAARAAEEERAWKELQRKQARAAKAKALARRAEEAEENKEKGSSSSAATLKRASSSRRALAELQDQAAPSTPTSRRRQAALPARTHATRRYNATARSEEAIVVIDDNEDEGEAEEEEKEAEAQLRERAEVAGHSLRRRIRPSAPRAASYSISAMPSKAVQAKIAEASATTPTASRKRKAEEAPATAVVATPSKKSKPQPSTPSTRSSARGKAAPVTPSPTKKKTAAKSSPAKAPSSASAARKRQAQKLADIKRSAHLVQHPTQLAASALEEEDAEAMLAKLHSGNLAGLSAHTKAKYLLHVGSTPSSLPCREREFGQIMEKVENAVDEGTGQCLYVSGVPGTGKTATVRQVVRTLLRKRSDAAKTSAPAGTGLKDFNFVEINGMKVTEAAQVYSILWHALESPEATGITSSSSSNNDGSSPRKMLSSKSALEKLRLHFDKQSTSPSAKDAKRKMTVLLLDEMDQLITTHQDVIYNLFNWPNTQNSKLLVIALANTMDLPQRALSAKVASRLGWQSVSFRPYDDKQLEKIVQARLGIATEGVELSEKTKTISSGCEKVFDPLAIKIMAKKVGNVNGDARRMLDIARRALEKVEQEAFEAGSPTLGQVKIAHVNAVFSDMLKSGKTTHIAALGLHAKVLLWSAIACIRKSGLPEITFEDLHAHHLALCSSHRFGVASSVTNAIAPISLEALESALATLCSLGLLIAVGSSFGSAHAGMHARFILGVREDETRFAFREDKDERFKNLA